MNRRPSASLLALAAVIALAAQVTPAFAASTRLIRTTASSTGPGTCSITIDSFGDPPSGPSLAAGDYKINVPIPAASSAASSTNLIRAAVDAALPADYIVTTVAKTPDIVSIHRAGSGTFTMLVSDDIPTQVMAEYVLPVPGVNAWTGALLAPAMLLAGAWWLRSRRRLVTG